MRRLLATAPRWKEAKMRPEPEYQVQTKDPGGRDLWKTVASFPSMGDAVKYVQDIPIGKYNMHPSRVRILEYSGGRYRIVG